MRFHSCRFAARLAANCSFGQHICRRMLRMKTPVLATLALSFLASSATARGAARLVYDLGHGQTSVITQMPELGVKLGFEVATVATPLNAEALRDARLLYLRTPLK